MSELADNSSNVSLNGHEPFITGNVPGQCETAFNGPPVSGSTTSGLVAGMNALTFNVDNCYPAVGENPTGVDFVAIVTYRVEGALAPSLGASYSGKATNTTESESGDLTLTGVSEEPDGQVSGDATFDSGLLGGGAYVGTVSGSSVELAIVSATRSLCSGGGCVAISLSGTIGPHGALSGTYLVYSGSGTGSHGVWKVNPEAEPKTISTAVAADDPVSGATGVNYTIDLTPGPSGALSSGAGTLAIAFPIGTTVAACPEIVLTDFTSSASGSPSSCSTSNALLTFTVPIAVGGGDHLQIVLSDMTNTAATGAQAVAISTSRDDTGRAKYALAPGGTLSGTVQYEASGGLQPVTGSIVQACDATGCYSSTTETASDGSYSLQLPVGTYTITAFPPTSNGYSVSEGSAGPIDISAGQPATEDVTLPAIAPIRSGVTFNGQSGTVGSVFWGSSAPLTVHGCQGGYGEVLVSSLDSQTDAADITFAGLTETAPDSGVYTANIPALYPSHGTGTVQSVVECPPATALAPASGPASGRNTVQISGRGFIGATAVMFGSRRASFSVVSGSEIDAVAPAGNGAVAVTVTTPAGTIGSATLGQYTYLTVSSVSPSKGSPSSGADVTITGSGFKDVQAVYFGDTTATDVKVLSDTEISASAPAGTGSVPVTVLTVDGGESSPADASFTYATPAANAASKQLTRPGHTEIEVRSEGPTAHMLTLLAQEMVASPSGPPSYASPASSPGYASPASGALLGALKQVGDGADVVKESQEVLEHAANECIFGNGNGSFSLGTAVINALRTVANSLATGAAAEWVLPALPILVEGLGAGAVALAAAAPYVLAAAAISYVTYELYEHGGETLSQIRLVASCVSDSMKGLIPLFENFSSFFVRIDPSGTVEDTNGNPIDDATVTLLRSDSPLGPFTAVQTGSPVMQPSINPETSHESGNFGWEVFAGDYQLTAAKAGCTDPGNGSMATVSTPTLPVPPPQVGLVLTLKCPHEAGPARPTVAALDDDSGLAEGGTQVDIKGAHFTSKAKVRFGRTQARAITVLSFRQHCCDRSCRDRHRPRYGDDQGRYQRTVGRGSVHLRRAAGRQRCNAACGARDGQGQH